jgi:Bacterial PH domain
MLNGQQGNDGWVIHYVSGGKMIFYLLVGIGCIPLGMYFMSIGVAKLTFAGVLFIIIGPILALKVCGMILGGGIAFRYNADGIEVPGLLGTRRLRWSDISKIGVVQHTQYAFGFIKTASTQYLYVHPASGWKLFVPTTWGGLSQGQMHELAATFNMLRSGREISSKRQSFSSDSDDSKNEYADAVVARYLARKVEEEKLAPAVSPVQRLKNLPGGGAVTFGKRRS